MSLFFLWLTIRIKLSFDKIRLNTFTGKSVEENFSKGMTDNQ